MAASSHETAPRAADYLLHMKDIVDKIDASAVERFSDSLFRAWQEDACVLTFGNGGSASTASHYVTDFIKTAAVEGARRLRAVCLNDNTPMLTAIGNDIDYEVTFSDPLDVYARDGDIVVAVSGSGTSGNIVRAAELALERGLELIALTGFEGGTLGPMADVHVNVPSRNYGVIEDLHMSIGHMVTQSLQARVAEATGGR